MRRVCTAVQFWMADPADCAPACHESATWLWRNLIRRTEEQTLRLWEKGRDKFMPGTAERLLRAVHSEFLGNNLHILRMLDKLADRDRIEGGNVGFTNKNGWKPVNVLHLEAQDDA